MSTTSAHGNARPLECIRFEDRFAAGCAAARDRRRRDARYSFGTALYDGFAYLVLPEGDADLDLRELWCRACDDSGSTRYGTRGHSTLYVALDPVSAMAETCYHALNEGRHDAGVRVHALYRLRVRGRFADLHGRERRHPELIADNYGVTQRLARDIRHSRLRGILYPSARSNGICLAAFTDEVLRSSRFVDFASTSVQSREAIRLCPAGSVHWRLLHRGDLRRAL